MLKKCYRCGKLLLFFKVNEFGRCKECEKIAKEEQRKNEIKEQKAKEQKLKDSYIKPAPNYSAPYIESVQNNKRGMVFTFEKIIEKEDIPILQKKYIAFDVETTGLSSITSRIIEVGAVIFENEKPVAQFSSLVNPNVFIPESATAVNHITNDMIKYAPSEEKVFSDLVNFLGDALDNQTIICAHNAKFDMAFLSETLMRLGYSGKINFVDTLSLSRRNIFSVDNHKQKTIAEYFGIVNDQEHRAVSDAMVCGEILSKLLDCERKEIERLEQESRILKEQMEILRKEYQDMRNKIEINPINNRVPLNNIRNLNDENKGFDKGFTYWQQGDIMRKAGNIESAIKLFDESRFNGYLAPALYESYAMSYRKLKDFDNEIDILDEAIERFKNNIYKCKDFETRRYKLICTYIKQKEKEQEKLNKEQEKQKKAAEKEAAVKEPPKPKGRAILKLSDDMVLIEKYETVSSAARENGISPKSIRDAANGVYKHAGGFVWRYADENNTTSQESE